MARRSSWTRRRLVTLGLLLVLCAAVVSVADPTFVSGLFARLPTGSVPRAARSHQQYHYDLSGLTTSGRTTSAGAAYDDQSLHPGDTVLGTWRATPAGVSTSSAPTPVTLTIYLYGPFTSTEARTQAQEGVRARMKALVFSQPSPGPEPAMTDFTSTDTWSGASQIATLVLARDVRAGLYFLEAVAHARGGWATASQTRVILAPEA
jgi:hypothetical protein